jgi:fatty acid desaturase
MTTLDHKAVIANLSADERVLLLKRSDKAGLTHLSLHLGAIAIGTSLIVQEVPLKPLVMLIQGTLLVFLFTTLHETVHQTPFMNRRLNDWVGRFCGFVVLVEPQWFRHFHLAHHRFTNMADKDPELSGPRPGTLGQYLWYLCGLPESVGRIKTLVRNAIKPNKDSFVSEHGKEGVKRQARIYVVIYFVLIGVSVAASTTVLLWVWLFPFLMAGPFLRAYLLAEHAGCPQVNSMFDNTRTTFTNSVVRFLAWNMPYHAEHHAYPAVPFYKLAEFHEHTKVHLTETENGYARFNRTYVTQLAAKPVTS